VYNIGGNVKSLKLLSLDIKRKDQCYNEYFVNEYIFDIKEYGEGKKPIIVMFMLKNQLLMSLKLIIMTS